MGDAGTEAPRPGRLRAIRLGLPPLRRRAGVPRGNRETRKRPAGTRRPAVAAARRSAQEQARLKRMANDSTHAGDERGTAQAGAASLSALDHAHMARALRLAERGLY